MKKTFFPAHLIGTVSAPASKSEAHRRMICAGLTQGETMLTGFMDSADMAATMRCLGALGSTFNRDGDTLTISGMQGKIAKMPVMDCGESGSTLRFFVPIALTVAGGTVFRMHGRLGSRPMDVYRDLFVPRGVRWYMGVGADGAAELTVRGKMEPGDYVLPGDVSSQFVSGLLFALPLLEGESEIRLTTKIESKGYIDMTLKTLKTFGITVTETENGWSIPGGQKYHGPRMRYAEGDWSNAAFWLVAGAIGGSIGCQGLDMESPQGDRAIAALLKEFGAETKVALNQITATHKEMKGIRIDASQIPDLVPILCVAAAAAEGKTEIYNAGRLRMKESDRLAVMAECMQKIGVEVEERPDSIIITGGCNPPEGEIVIDSHNDHRIVMAMAIAAVSLGVELTILGAEAVNKSYPSFFIELAKLGGVTNVL